MTHHDDRFRDELELVAERLRAERPTATPLELDSVKQRVLMRSRRQREAPGFMRTRGAIVVSLVLGFMLSTTGAGMAVSGFTHTGQAAQTGYPTPPAPTVPAPTTGSPTGQAPSNDVLGETNTGEDTVLPAGSENGNDVEAARQVQAQSSGNTLPFTGFAAIPVLLLGLVLLSLGFIGRRSARNH
jgi:hypothetical protein